LGIVVLARLLAPEDFGLMAMAMAVAGFLLLFRDAGLGEALIQERQDPADSASLVFWAHLLIGSFSLLALWLAAPLVAAYFQRPEVTPLLRVLGFLFVLHPFSDVPLNLLLRDLRFSALFWRQAAPVLLWAGTAIAMAAAGLGLWSLVGGELAGALGTAAMAWGAARWRPRWVWNAATLARVFRFGLQVSAQNFFSWICSSVDQIFAGRFLGAQTLGFYRVSRTFGEVPWLLASRPFNAVLYPVLCRAGSDPDAIKPPFLAALRWMALASIPVGTGLAFLAPSVVPLALGAKWLDAIPLLQVLAVAGIGSAILDLTPQVYKALGRPRIATRLFFFQALATVPASWWAAQQSIFLLAVVQLVLAWLFGVVDIYVCARVLRISAGELLSAMKTGLALGAVFIVLGFGGRLAGRSLQLGEHWTAGLLLLAFALAALLALRHRGGLAGGAPWALEK
jgi:PST family polysaccharide transporter